MEQKVEVKINYTDKDVKDTINYIINHIHKLWVCFICAGVVELFLLFNCYKYGFSNYYILLLTVFGIVALVFYLYYYHRPVSGYINFYRKRKGGTYIFSSQHIEIIGEEIQSVCSWSMYKGGFEIPHAIVLTDENDFLYIFPKRCFEGKREIDDLRDLLGEKVINFKMYIKG